MRVAVTGASGFVGGAVCRELAAQGHEVVGYGRRPAADLGGVPYRSWDITSGPLADAPEVDAVVHCAGTVTDWGPIEEFFATNVDGTKNVLATFPYARFVHVSTASVYDPHVPTVMATEDQAPVRRYVNGYGASKAAAERAVLAARPSIILRPHAIYGPGDTTLLPRVLAAVRGPVLLGVGTGRQLVSLTSVANLVQACLLATCGPVESGIFNVTDAFPVVLDEAMQWILKERGIRARTAYLPVGAVMPLVAAVEGVFLLAGTAKPPRLTRYALGHLAVERTLDISAACKHLGYSPTETSFDGAGSW